MNTEFTISQSAEKGKLELHLTDMSFMPTVVQYMNGIQRVGSRRNEAGSVLYYVLSPEAEAPVRAAVARAAAYVTPEAIAARQARHLAVLAEAARFAAAEEVKAAAKAARAVRDNAKLAEKMAQVRITTRDTPWHIVVGMPYAAGAPAKLREIGGNWDANAKSWSLPTSARAALDALMPELRKLVVKQQAKDAKPAKAVGPRYSDRELEDMSDDGMTSRLGQSAWEVRQELGAFGR